MYSKSVKINVLSASNPTAMMSLMFSRARRHASSTSSARHSAFSSSVSWMTRGHLRASCNHLVNIKGTRWPKCSASDDGPRPVYK